MVRAPRDQHDVERARRIDAEATDRWHEVDAVFEAALGIPAGERGSYLGRVCATDPALRQRVESLLAEDRALGEFLESPCAALEPEDGVDTAEVDGLAGAGYRVISRLGAGGMGTVYLAAQEEPVERRVALKIIKPGSDSADAQARFEGERKALALLDHPNIARIYDAGRTASGRAYLAMEYVPGAQVTVYCDRLRLTLEARVRLFLQICAGMQHAHQKGLIHRDLKPGNLLVREVPGEAATVKVIDFGVVKSLQRPLTFDAAQTQSDAFIGTPVYASPEQIWGRSADVDTRADLYAVGAVLYELLVGVPPYSVDELGDQTPWRVARLLWEHELPSPRERLSSIGEDVDDVARCRSLTAEQLHRRLRGDLSWIVMRCLERDPNDRYASVSELRRDLEDWLDHRPITSRSVGAWYRLRKCLRRHRVGAAVAAGVSVLLLVTSAMAIVGLARAASSALEAELAAHDAQRVADFQVEQLRSVDPAVMGQSLRRIVTDELGAGGDDASDSPADPAIAAALRRINFTNVALEALDRWILEPAEDVIAEDFGPSPLLQARLWQSMAETLHALGRLERALVLQERALALRGRTLGADHPLTLAAQRGRGHLRVDLGEQEGAEADLVRARAGLRRSLGARHRETLDAIRLLGELRYRQGETEAGEALTREALAGFRATLGDDHPQTLGAINNLAVLLVARGKLAEAEPLHFEAMNGRRRVMGEESVETLQSVHNLALLLVHLGRPDEAELRFREVVAGKRRMLGEEHPMTLNAVEHLGRLLLHLERVDQAEPYLRQAFEGRCQVLGENHPDTERSLTTLGRLYQAQGRFDQAEDTLRRSMVATERRWGAEHLKSLSVRSHLATSLHALGRLDEAHRMHRAVVEAGRRAGPPPYQLGVWLNGYGRCLTTLGHFDEAEGALREALTLLDASGDTGSLFRVQALEAMVELSEARHRERPHERWMAEAERWRGRLETVQGPA